MFENPENTSNARVTTKVARLCLESLNPSLQDYGSAIVYNIANRDIRVSGSSFVASQRNEQNNWVLNIFLQQFVMQYHYFIVLWLLGDATAS